MHGSSGGVSYADPAARAAYCAGVQAALDGIICKLPGPLMRELEEWLADLARWTGGPPPPAPHEWALAG